jgi:hypothetical protein
MQLCPALKQTNAEASGTTDSKSVSSRITVAALPPSSRRTRLTVAEAAAMTLRPVTVDPVNATASTRGSVVSAAATSFEDDVSTFRTPAGRSVRSTARRPRCAPDQGDSGDGFSTTVQPAASAAPTLARSSSTGMFHGVITDTTPSGSRKNQLPSRSETALSYG